MLGLCHNILWIFCCFIRVYLFHLFYKKISRIWNYIHTFRVRAVQIMPLVNLQSNVKNGKYPKNMKNINQVEYYQILYSFN